MITVHGVDAKFIEILKQRPEIGKLTSDAPFKVDLEKPGPIVENFDEKAEQPRIEWSIEWVKANKVWEKGYKGKNFTIASADTGVQWEHEAIMKNYRGYNEATGTATHDYNWVWRHVRKIDFFSVGWN